MFMSSSCSCRCAATPTPPPLPARSGLRPPTPTAPAPAPGQPAPGGPGEVQRRPEGLESVALEPTRGRRGKGARKKKKKTAGVRVREGGCTIRWASFDPGAEAERLPEDAREMKDPLRHQPPASPHSLLPGSSPTPAYTCALHAGLENFPLTPSAPSHPTLPGVVTLLDSPSRLVSLP